MSREVCVIGGGLVGLATAVMLTERGAHVTLIDAGPVGGGASQGNAGYYCGQLVAPLASPGQIKSAFKSFRDPSRPLRVRPSAIPSMLTWGLRFARASTSSQYQTGRASLVNFNARRGEVLDRFVALGIDGTLSQDLMAPFNSEAFGKHFLEDLKPLAQFGLPVPEKLLDGIELRALIPALTDHVTCGVILEGDRGLDPRKFTQSMVAYLREHGAVIHESTTVSSVDIQNGVVRALRTSNGPISSQEYVIAAGSASRRLGRMFDLNLPIVPGTGYNVGIAPSASLTRPVIFEEPRVAVSPLGDQIRLGGTMEFGGENASFDQRRVDAIKKSLSKFVDLDLSNSFGTWSAGRPLTPDGLPMVGRPASLSNTVVAVGHGMFGLTLAPATGLAVTELLMDGKSSFNLHPFNPERF